MTKPKVSVAILAYGNSGRLKRAIDNIQSQTYDNIEIIVIYDGVADEVCKKIVHSYGNRIKYYKNQNQGAISALNLAIKKATGQYFSWLSQNDTYSPEKIDKEIMLINGQNNAIAVSGWVMVNRNDRKIQAYPVDYSIVKNPACFLAFVTDVRLNMCAMLFPMAILKDGIFDKSLPPTREYKLLNKMISGGVQLRTTNDCLLNYDSRSDERYLNDQTINTEDDFIYSDLIEALSYDSILRYFDGLEGAADHYRKILNLGQARSAAFLMKKILVGSLDAEEYEQARNLLLDDLSGLPEDKMANSSSSLLSKILQPSDKKKVMFSSAHWLTGGMERVMSTLFRELESDYEIFLITPYDSRESQIDIPAHVTHVSISDENFQKHFDVMILSYALLLKIDLVIGYMNLFEKQLNFYKLCEGTDIKTVASNHEYYFYPYKSDTQYNVVEKRLNAFAKCDAIVWANNFNAALCGMYVKNNYVIGNPNNFDISQEIILTKENLIICVGRFNDYVKRIDRILRSFSLVLERTPDAKLVVVGKHDNDAPIGPNESSTVNGIIDELAIPLSNISFVGEVNNVQDYYAKAKVLMMTSNSEGFGMVLNEAACFGVPSVSNYIPGIEDIISNGRNGYITDQDDIRSMASRVGDILEDNALRRRLGDDALKRVKSFDARYIGDKWRFLINSLIEGGDENNVHKKISSRIGYSIQSQQLFSRVLSQEINEIFYMSSGRRGTGRTLEGKLLILSKIVRLPGRLRTNIQYEGFSKTIDKIVTRAHRIVRSKLKI